MNISRGITIEGSFPSSASHPTFSLLRRTPMSYFDDNFEKITGTEDITICTAEDILPPEEIEESEIIVDEEELEDEDDELIETDEEGEDSPEES